MKLSEQIDIEYDKANALDGRCDISRDTLLGWKNEVTQLEAELEMYERDETFGTMALQLALLEVKNEALKENS